MTEECGSKINLNEVHTLRRAFFERIGSMENVKLKAKSTHLLKIDLNDLNDPGDYITVSADDSALFDRFSAGSKRIFDLVDHLPAKLEEIEKRYNGKEDLSDVMEKTLEISEVNVDFSKEVTDVVDGIFGEGTLKKYFRRIYDEIPEFLPDANCVIDFLEQIIPVMEELFNRKIERQRAASRERMAKYQPQDFKKPSGYGKRPDRFVPLPGRPAGAPEENNE